MEHIHEVIIIGAGFAGLAASKKLTQNGVEHIVIESRDRIGGRVCPQKFSGLTLDIGATFLHNSPQDNLLSQFIASQDFKLKTQTSQQFYHEGRGLIPADQLERISQLQQTANSEILSSIQKSQGKCSLRQALDNFISVELDGEQPAVRDVMLWKVTFDSKIKGMGLEDYDANVLMFNTHENYMLVEEGGLPAVFERLQKHCKTQIRFNTRVLSIDYAGKYVRIHTTNGLYSAKRLISSLPLGVLKTNKVKFNPPLPQSHQSAIETLAVGHSNRLLCKFTRPFWTISSGWLVFATRNNKNNRYPLAFAYPSEEGKYVLLVFVAGDACGAVGEMSEQQICMDFRKFLGRFVELSQVEIQEGRASKWHKDQHALGSYCIKTKTAQVKHFKEIRQSIDDKVWFVGQHVHPAEMGYANGAYETGVWAGKEVVESLQGRDQPSVSVEL